MRLQTGVRLGHYEIRAPIGAGGMGEVYRAQDVRLGRDVAIKVLPEGLADTAEGLARFEREARVLAALSHPNLLSIFDVGTDQGISFAVIEFLSGETLQEHMRRSPIPLARALEIGAAVAEGLAVAHTNGVVHRDLKPSNIFLTSGDQTKILDFGLARFQTPVPNDGATTPYEPDLTEFGRVMGTASYMSPEQVRGESLDGRGDIFSLGCVLYEMATGRPAFPGRTYAEIMAAVLRDDPAELDEPGKSFPLELKQIISRCLDKLPERRFQSASDLAFALKTMRGRSAEEAPASAPASRFGNRPCLAVLPFQNLSANKEENEYLVDGMTEALITDLAKIRSLRVISRTSVMQYKGTKKPLREIARELEADAVVEGSVLYADPSVRIIAQLIRAETDEHLWAESYQREVRDILVLQSEVARAIAEEINAALTPDELAHFGSAQPVKAEAYDAYLKARYHFNRGSADGLRQGVEYLRQAIELDSGLALGYVGVDPDMQWLRSPILKGGIAPENRHPFFMRPR